MSGNQKTGESQAYSITSDDRKMKPIDYIPTQQPQESSIDKSQEPYKDQA